VVTIRETAIIQCPPSSVWPFLTNAELIPRWNDKVTRLVPKSAGSFRLHYQFNVTFHLNGKEREFAAEVTEYDEPNRLIITQHSLAGEPMEASETITLTPARQGTKIERVIKFSSKQIPWWARVLVWFITRLGKPVGEPVLEKLGRMVESGNDATK
jgi:uncharacterized protein YndB with AHSA1/START domain